VLRNALAAINDNYLNVQQDILETFVDRGQLRKLTEPTITPTGKRIPGLKLDHPRQLALMHALVRFAHIAGGNTFTTAELYSRVLAVLGCPAERYTLASLRYDLAKLRAKGLVAKLPNSRRSTPAARLLNLLGLPEAVRTSLCAAHCRPSQPSQRRSPNRSAKAIAARSPLSTCRR